RRGIDRAPDGTVELQVVARDGRTWLRPATLADVPSLLADPTVRTLSLPAPVRPARLVEGVGLTGADLAHASGARGGGCRLAIVDAGFDGYSELVARGAAPVPAATLDLTSSGLEKTSKHGAAVAEI